MGTAMASLVLLAALLLPLAAAAAATKDRRNCSQTCGDNDYIPYPFGLGPSCSLPGFSLTCAVDDTGKGNISRLLLGNPSNSMEVSFRRSSFVVYTSIWYSMKMLPGVRDYPIHWEAPGRHFAISGKSDMSLFIVGCDVRATLFVGTSAVEVGSCSVVCGEAHVMEKLPQGSCDGVIGLGCCFIRIGLYLRAFTLNISRISDSSPRSEKVQAFITDMSMGQEISPIDAYSGLDPQSYGMNVHLDWSVPYQPDCKRALEHRDSYVCVNKHSKCVDSPIGGYNCYCQYGKGNSYVDDGCAEDNPPVLSSIQPRMDCPTTCGNVSVPFPFGTEVGCFAKLPLYLACIPRTTALLSVLEWTDGTIVTDISIEDGVLYVREASKQDDFIPGSGSDSTLYALSGKLGVVKWAIDNVTCEHAKLNKSDYRCFSSHSDCLDVTDDGTLKHLGYRCKCSFGFEGNPYMKDGCTDINECLHRHPHKYICNGICHNRFGSYTCTGAAILAVIIGLSSGGGILFLVAIVAILYWRWNRVVQKRLRKMHFRKNKGILLEQLISSDRSSNDGTKIFSLEELQKATNNFDRTRVVGHGGHGTVYKGILTDQRVVAIKKSTLTMTSEIEEFINEVSILSQINHRNVVKLHGCCLESEVPLLVYEFISNGTLYDLLHREHDSSLLPLSWEERVRIATEIAGALAYLHSAASVSILHRDVKCMNVLLNDSRAAKVSDFGASRLIPTDQTHLVTAVQGTFGYLDPEYYHTGQFNEKSDVYSFGVILVELLTRRKPIIQNNHGEKQNLSNYFLLAMRERPLKEIVDVQILEEGAEEGFLCMARLAEECLSLTRGERPIMKDVEIRLQLLAGRRVAPWARRDELAPGARCEASQDDVVSVVGQHDSRQYSQEQEFVSSLRVPR